MKFYKVTTDEGLNVLVSTQLDAKQYGVKTPEVTEVPTDKEALREFVNAMLLDLHHATVREQIEEQPENIPAPAPVQEQPNYTDWSVKLDDAWDKLPLAHKLHFAAMAMEEARKAI